MALSPGQLLGAFEVVGPLGAGGMGEVYRARDTRLDRDVAIKVLPDRTARDERALARFRAETKALAALSHPNILMILDIGEHDGQHYAVMELLEGQTLRERLNSSGVDWRRALEIATAVAEGLAAAHDRDIVHRDIKPENLFLTQDGVIKILDFGLARTDSPVPTDGATVTAATQPGTVMGTVNYMSPEQVRGHTADARTDVFSLGSVLYEMLTGAPPFVRDNPAETMTAILRDHPAQASTSRQHVPEIVDPIVTRCLEKSAHERFHSARDLAFSLRTALRREATAPRRPDVVGKVLSAVVGLALIVGVTWMIFGPDRGSSPDPQTHPSGPRLNANPRLAVLPFDDHSPTPQLWYANGLADAIHFELSQISGLSVANPLELRRFKHVDDPLLGMANELDVSHVIQGSLVTEGDRIQLRVRVIETTTAERVWSNRFDRPSNDILGVQDDVARAIAAAVRVVLTDEDEQRLAPPPTVDPRAHEHYVLGMSFVRQGSEAAIAAAMKQFEAALAIDSNYALGYVGIAHAYDHLASEYDAPHDTMPHVKVNAEQALAIDDTLAEAHALMGYYYLKYDHNWEASRLAFEKAIDLDPDNSQARIGYATYLVAMIRIDEAMRQLDMVREFRPTELLIDRDFGTISFMARHYDQTLSDAQAALELDPDWYSPHMWLALAYSQLGEDALAVKHARELMRLTRNAAGFRAMAGGIIASAEDDALRTEAAEIYEELKETEAERYVCPYELATIPLGLGDHDTAFMEMDRACDARADCLAWLQVDPRVDPIRDDPRFEELLIRVGFEPPQEEDPADPTQ